jgi:uroporphyrinogen-III synthase
MSTRSVPAWQLISLRPRGQHAPMRQAAARRGGGVIAVSPWALQPLHDARARAALAAALAASRVLFTSPAAVRAAHALQPLRARPGQAWFAVGSGTAAALRAAGVDGVMAPERMDSEGLLALPGLRGRMDGSAIGLVTAPGGRGMLAPALEDRGARVLRADVYRREPLSPTPRAVAALRALRAPAAIAVSSGEGLQQVHGNLPAELVARLHRLPVVAASDRLVELAHTLGFATAGRARSARPADLAEAAAAALR